MALPERDYLECFEDWKNRCHKCILSGGNYYYYYGNDLED